MKVSEKSHQNISDYIKFLFKKIFEVNKNRFILMKTLDIKVIILTRPSERGFSPMRFTGYNLF